MVADFLFRVACHGGGDEPLNVHLKRITDSAYTRKCLGGDEIEGEGVAPVIAESHDADCRREIMHHLRDCLSENSGRRWQRIYGGLALTEKLMQHGSPALLTEVAQGLHFDIVQKVSFLERFDAAARGCTDRRAQKVVRDKAAGLRKMLVAQIEDECAGELRGLDSKDSLSTCSGGASTATPSTAASSTRSSPTSAFPEPRTPSRDLDIDDAFVALREWMNSAGSSRASSDSSPSSPRTSEFSFDSSGWEPIGAPPQFSAVDAVDAADAADAVATMQVNTSCNDSQEPRQEHGTTESEDLAEDAFFTPMMTPAFAPAADRATTLLSL